MTNKKNILVVDDDPVFKLIAKKLFERSGDLFKVFFAENGLEAIGLINSALDEHEDELPDIILLDIEMPVMNGWDFMDEFIKIPREKRNRIDIYTVSSSMAHEDKIRSAAYPEIRDYITKPITSDIIDRFL